MRSFAESLRNLPQEQFPECRVHLAGTVFPLLPTVRGRVQESSALFHCQTRLRPLVDDVLNARAIGTLHGVLSVVEATIVA